MVPTSIYDFLKTELLSGTHPNLAAFSDWLQEYINQYEPYKGTDQVDIVDTAMNYPDLFDVYFTRHGYMTDKSFVVCKAGLSIPQIYKELELNEYRDFSLNEFYYHLFRVDEDGHINPTAIAKELKFPEHMIFNGGWKYSYNLEDEPYKVETYTSIEDKTLYKDELDEFKLKNELPKDYDQTDWTEFHNKLKTQFGLSDEEAEDLMINYFNIYSKIKSSFNESLNEDKRQKYLYSYGGPVYRFERLYSEYWEGYTEAVSLKEAIRNLNQQAKKYFGFTPDAKLNIDPDYVLCNDESSEEEFEEHRTCPNCGRRLIPSGECVLCDLGDESVLDEGVELVNDFLYESLSLYKLSEELKDEVSENTLKKRREYYLTHGLKDIFPAGLGEDIEKHDDIYKVEWHRNLPSNISAKPNQTGVDYFIAKDEDDAKQLVIMKIDLVSIDKITKLTSEEVSKLDGAYKRNGTKVEWVDFEENLNEDIEKHDTLNPLLFDENDELKPEIKEAIEKIVNQFVEDLKTDGVKIEVKDVILVGSNVSYNYTKDSDLDIHIIVDKDNLDCDPEVYNLLYGAYRSLFNKNYDITIKGIPVEIYVELY